MKAQEKLLFGPMKVVDYVVLSLL